MCAAFKRLFSDRSESRDSAQPHLQALPVQLQAAACGCAAPAQPACWVLLPASSSEQRQRILRRPPAYRTHRAGMCLVAAYCSLLVRGSASLT